MVQITNKVRPPKPLRGIPVDNNDLASTLARDLGLQKYECMVCWEIIKANQATWSCECCWAIFHLGCIEQWAQYSLEGESISSSLLCINPPIC
jgi:transcriptional repressor NF-X1